jgi:hypothetical protein
MMSREWRWRQPLVDSRTTSSRLSRRVADDLPGGMLMYNLIVGFIEGVASLDRMLEYTDDAVRQYVAPSGALDVSRLVNFPTLVMPELQDRRSPQLARVGDVADLALTGRDYRFRFVPDPAMPAIASDQIEKASRWLGIGDWEFNRHHWRSRTSISTGCFMSRSSGRLWHLRSFGFLQRSLRNKTSWR